MTSAPTQDALFAAARVEPDPVVAAVPVGPDLRAAWGPDGRATAAFSACGDYRYRLSRVWDPTGPRVVFCMLNPSTADHLALDNTVRRCVRFARAWGFGALEVVNAFAYRATDPAKMATQDDPVGPGNDEALLAAAGAGELVVAAWGVHATLHGREQAVRRLLDGAGVDLHYLRLTKDGHPGHPLYVPAATNPTPWR